MEELIKAERQIARGEAVSHEETKNRRKSLPTKVGQRVWTNQALRKLTKFVDYIPQDESCHCGKGGI